MSTLDGFVVEVKGELRESPELIRERLAEVLKLSPEKTAALVARMPGVISKPLPEERALRVALRLQAAGLAAVHRRADAPVGDPTVAVATEPPSSAAPAVSEPPSPNQEEASVPAPSPTPASTRPPAPAPIDAPIDAPSMPDAHRPEAAAAAGPRHPTGYDQIPSLDATRIEEPSEIHEPDPKLTPMSEAGFGAADIVLPVEPARQAGARGSTIVESGPVSRPMPRQPARVAPGLDTDDADPTMVMPLEAEPGEVSGTTAGRTAPRTVRFAPVPMAHQNGARSGVGAAGEGGVVLSGDHPVVAPALRLRDAIKRDRGSGERPRDRRSALTEKARRVTPPQEVVYRSTKSPAERALTLTPPSDAALRRGGVREGDLARHRQQRRGRFGRRLSTFVALPVVLSWLVSAGLIYLLLPPELHGELLVPLAAATAIAALSGALAASLATARAARDVVRLRTDAERIAMGDLSSPVQGRRTDELGDVAAALERLRVSLQEAMTRLRKSA